MDIFVRYNLIIKVCSQFKQVKNHSDGRKIMVCSKCGYAIARGQLSCVYCGTKVDTTKTENTAPKRTTSAFAKQLKSSQSDAQAEKTTVTAVKEEQKSVHKPVDTLSAPKSSPFSTQKQSSNSPFAQQPASATAAKPQVIAPYAVRPMYSSFDPNSEDSPFVRKPLNIEPETAPDTQQAEPVSQISEEQPVEKAAEEDTAAEVSGEKTHKKHGLSIAALTLAFVTLVVFVFISF